MDCWLATPTGCWFSAAFPNPYLPTPVSAGVIGRTHRLRSSFPPASLPTNRPGEVLDLLLGVDPTGQSELATAKLDSILLPHSATTGRMAVIAAIHPLAASSGVLLFTRSIAINGFPLPHALVAGLDAVADGLDAVWHWPDAPLP